MSPDDETERDESAERAQEAAPEQAPETAEQESPPEQAAAETAEPEATDAPGPQVPEVPEPETSEPQAEAAEAPEAEAEQADAPEPEAEQPEQAEAPEAEGGPSPGQPDAAEQPDAPSGEESATAPPRRQEARPGGGEKEVVPGANLEPIAITEERELTAEERAALEAEAEERAKREAAAREADEELPRRGAVSMPTDAAIQATGKRKNSVARVVLRAGSGGFEVNARSLDDYFPRAHHQSLARQPLVTAGYDGSLEVKIRVHGGGISGQADAVRHGIARALVELDPELRGDLKRRGMLTRDARQKERRKAGLKKARKRPQFSKR